MRRILGFALLLFLVVALAHGNASAVTIHNGLWTDPLGLIYGKVLSGSEESGYTYDPTTLAYTILGPTTTEGDARDWYWVHDAGGNAADYHTGILYDLGGLADQLVVFPIIDHGPLPQEADEYDVWFSNDLVNWTEGTLTDLYDQGWSPDPNVADGWTTVWTAPFGQFRYASVAWGNPGNPDASYLYEDGDAEIDAVAGLVNGQPVSPVPEPGTLFLLGAGILPIARRLRKKS